MLEYLFTVIVGGLAFRAVAQTKMLLNAPVTLRPHIFSKNDSFPVLITVGFWVTLASALFLGWHAAGLVGLIFRPLLAFIASLLFTVLLNGLDGFLARRRLFAFAILLSPIYQLYIFPYILLVGAIFVAFV